MSFNRLLLVIIGIVGCCLGSLGVIESTSTQPLLQLARLVERQQLQQRNLTGLSLSASERYWIDATCLPKRKRAAISIQLGVLDAYQGQKSNTPHPLNVVDAALAETLTSLEKLLLCAPADGNAWLRLAMVLTTAEGPTDGAIQALQRSLWMAPHEAWITPVRATFTSRLVNAGIANDRVLNVLRSDAETFARAARTAELKHFLRTGGAAAVQALKRAQALLDPERNAEVQSMLPNP